MKNFTPFFICFCLLLFGKYSEAQVTKISNNTNFQLSVTLGSKAMLVDDKDSIWVTNGTPAGTKKLTTKVVYKDQLAIYKGKIFFSGRSGTGTELWMTDCTAQGTKLVKNINPGAQNSSPTGFFVHNNILFFFAKTNTYGFELWKSDGTEAGTIMVKDIWQGSGSSNETAVLGFYSAGGVLYFQANDGINGDELWKTNGTAAGTVLVKNLSPGSNSLEINTWHSLNNKLIFVGKDSDLGIKVWQTDGTSAGTTLLKTLYPTSSSFLLFAQSLSYFKNKLFFSLTGYTPQFTQFNQLYSTDGTGTNTVLLKDLGDRFVIAFGTLTPTLNNKFYFTTFAGSGSTLWESNGTPTGTVITKIIGDTLNLNNSNIPVILPNFLVSHPDSVATSDFKGRFFMFADNGKRGYEPWITDGTEAGTKMLKDINPMKASSINSENFILPFYSKKGLYFAANDNVDGNELWFSNGASLGTNQVADINNGPDGSSPVLLGILNNRLLLSARDGDSPKKDLYKVDEKFDTLSLAKTESEDAIIAPDGTKFSIYPNPAKDLLNVNLSKSFNSDKISLVITDQKGKQVYENQLSGMQFSSTYKIDISDLAQGTYYLEVRTDKGVVSKKFIKIR